MTEAQSTNGVGLHDLRRAIVDDMGTMRPLNAQDLVEAEADDWAVEWAEGVGSGTLEWPTDLGQLLPVPTPIEMKRGMASFPPDTGMGWEAWHPRAWLRLGDAMVAALARSFAAAEKLGDWPTFIGWVVAVLLPKGNGGFRPIGLFPSLIRLWVKVRRTQLRDSERLQQGEYFYAGAARGANVAAWQQAAVAEAAVSRGASFAQVLVDMVKAFDRVPRQRLVDEAARVKYPLHLLRLAMMAYAMPRVVMIGGVVFRIVCTTRGIAAGSGSATTELRALLIGLLDKLTTAHPAAKVQAYIDDITLNVLRTARLAATIMIRAARMLCAVLVELGLTRSATKCQCTASTPAIGQSIAMGLSEFGIRYSDRVKSLGVGMGAGRRRTVAVLKARYQKFVPRVLRFRRLRHARVAAARVLHTGGTAAMDDGVAATGLSDAALMQRRRIVAAAMGEYAEGRQLDMVYVAEAAAGREVDPAVMAHTAPIGALAEAHWCRRLPARMLCAASVTARTRLTKAKRLWSNVTGPFSSAVAAAARIGWVLTDGDKLTTDRGRLVDLRLDPPLVVKRLVKEAVERWRWRRADVHLPGIDPWGCGDGAMMEPLRRLLRPAPDTAVWNRGTRAALRSALTGGQWTQARLVAAGLHDDNRCRACLAQQGGGGGCSDLGDVRADVPPPAAISADAGVDVPMGAVQDQRVTAHGGGGNADLAAPSHVASGCAWHRCFQCGPNRSRRKAAFPDSAKDDDVIIGAVTNQSGMLRGAGTVNRVGLKTLMTRGVVPMPRVADNAVPADGTFAWRVQPAGEAVAVTLYTDGSLLDGPKGPFTRLGWSFVALDKDGRNVASAHGTPPTWVEGTAGAEAWALLMAARFAMPSAGFRCDNLGVVQGLRRGAGWALGPDRPQARVWATLLAYFDDDAAAEKRYFGCLHIARFSMSEVLASVTGRRLRLLMSWEMARPIASRRRPLGGTVYLRAEGASGREQWIWPRGSRRTSAGRRGRPITSAASPNATPPRRRRRR